MPRDAVCPTPDRMMPVPRSRCVGAPNDRNDLDLIKPRSPAVRHLIGAAEKIFGFLYDENFLRVGSINMRWAGGAVLPSPLGVGGEPAGLQLAQRVRCDQGAVLATEA